MEARPFDASFTGRQKRDPDPYRKTGTHLNMFIMADSQSGMGERLSITRDSVLCQQITFTPMMSAANNEIDLCACWVSCLTTENLFSSLPRCSRWWPCFYALFATPVYQADALIQVEAEAGQRATSNL